MFPQSCVRQWKQTEYFRKFAVGFRDALWQEPADPVDLRVVRLDLNGPLAESAGPPAETLLSPPPIQRERQWFADPTRQMTVRLGHHRLPLQTEGGPLPRVNARVGWVGNPNRHRRHHPSFQKRCHLCCLAWHRIQLAVPWLLPRNSLRIPTEDSMTKALGSLVRVAYECQNTARQISTIRSLCVGFSKFDSFRYVIVFRSNWHHCVADGWIGKARRKGRFSAGQHPMWPN